MASKEISNIGKTFFDMKSIVTPEKIADVKLKMMSPDSALQIQAVSWISTNLNTASDAVREHLLETLITTDVITFMCEKICCSHGELFLLMLKILDKLRFNANFYKKKLAKLAIVSILRVAFIMVKKMDVHEETLTQVTYTICVLLYGASRAEVSLDKICNINQMVEFVKRLNPVKSTKYVLRISAAKLLCLIMVDIKLVSDEETESSLFTMFQESLLSIGEILVELKDSKYSTDLSILQTSMKIVCSTCALGVRFCKLGGRDFDKEITKVMIQIVIPQFKATKFESEEYKVIAKNFVECLDQIFQLKNCDKELANTLATNGYLKYFLQTPLRSLRRSVCSLVSRIIAKLSEHDISCSDEPKGLTEFRDYINEGLLALPSNVDHPPDIFSILETEGIASNALLVLLYHHIRKTHEYELMSLTSMILKVITLSGNQPIPFLKAAWFLFVVSSLKRSAASSVCHYGVAVRHLAALLQNHDLRKCYTHDPVILDHGLTCEDFPDEIRHEIVRLWLDFDGDIKTLVAGGNSELMTECLVSTIEKSSEKLVNRAMDVITELKCVEKHWVRKCGRIWERLPNILACCNAGTAVNAKGLLKLALNIKPEGKNFEHYGESAAILAKVLGKEDLDDELKILLVQYVRTLLTLSCECNNPAVVASFVNEAQSLTTLRHKGWARENFHLSAFCIDLLAYIVECQEKFKVQCDESGILKIEPLKMLVLLARSKYELFRAAERLLLILLNQGEAVRLVVSLRKFESNEKAKEAIFAWYMRLHQLLPKTRLTDWQLLYRCLMAVLTFCEKNNYPEILKELCDYSGTYELVRWTIDHKYADPIFFDYTELWLQFGHTYLSANVVQASCSRLFQDLCIADTDFHEIIKMLSEYRAELNSGMKL